MKTKKAARQPKLKQKLNGRYLLPLVLVSYALLYNYYPDKTIAALSKSLSTLLHLLPIFLVVIVLMGVY